MQFYLYHRDFLPEGVPRSVEADNEIEAAKLFDAHVKSLGGYIHVHPNNVTRIEGRSGIIPFSLNHAKSDQ
ncbi:hypothetical protein [Rhizobium sp. AG207R]|uniref:hypothetical protein n=1 Tax=Rhizobium sp. AG207R TaxID=2802287 RepID=UPI0022ABCB0E|nr:hypothetical protein [Rhizobium sp. AG207R]MCZ3377408.1 hypothetical protein [Rhizobium sp. AG207R]